MSPGPPVDRLKQSQRRTAVVLAVVLVASIVAVATVTEPFPNPMGEGLAGAVTARNIGTPVLLSIPAAGVEAALERLETDDDHTLQPPRDAMNAGWFGDGPEPGERGAAIVAGHLDTRSGPAVFHRLPKLRPGDLITVHGTLGVVTFAVDRVVTYPKNSVPDHKVYARTSMPTMRLITCGGRFDPTSGHYDDNVVVFASLAV